MKAYGNPARSALAILVVSLGFAVLANAAEEEKLARGILLESSGKLVLAPCRDRSYVTVNDISREGWVTKALAGIGLGGSRKIYAELVGKIDNSVLAVSALNFAYPDGRCQAPGGKDETWQAAGEGWLLSLNDESVSVRRGDGKAVAKAMAGSVPPVAAETTDWSRSGPGYAVRFQRQACRSKDGAVFGWQAAVEFEGQRLSGCAWQR
jgi:putative lipoprotein